MTAPDQIAPDEDVTVEALREALDDVGVEASLHARDVDSDAQIGLDADADVALCSVFKVPVLLELMRQAAGGEIDLTRRIKVPVEGRTPGPSGLSILADEVELSVRDLAVSMMYVSDNASTDVVMDLVGIDRIQATLKELGLERTSVPEDCRTLLDRLASEVGFERAEDLGSPAATEALLADPSGYARRLAATSLVAPRDTNQSTPRETTRLLQLIWRDEAGPAEACEQVRAVMARQLFSHRLSTGFPGEVAVAAKTGTLPFLKNEAGVVTYPDGGRYAVTVFTRGRRLDTRQPDQDRVIGTVARIAVDHLREVAGLPTDVSLHATL